MRRNAAAAPREVAAGATPPYDSPMLIVGLTGNIAAGKSVVAARLRALGATVIDADLLARDAVRPGTPALAGIVERWGTGILAQDGTLDRAALRRIVFTDPAARAELDAVVHPEVARRRDAELALARARGDRLVISDVPLLFEAGLEGTVDRIVLVDAPDATRVARLVRERGLSAVEARSMMAAQMPAEGKRARAHHVITNDGSLAALDVQVSALHRELVGLAALTLDPH